MSTAIKAAQDAAVEAIRRDLETLVSGGDLTSKVPIDRLANLLAHGAFGAMVIPAEYVAGHRDAMTEVRTKLGPIVNADHWIPVSDPAPEAQEGS